MLIVEMEGINNLNLLVGVTISFFFRPRSVLRHSIVEHVGKGATCIADAPSVFVQVVSRRKLAS